MLQLAQQQSRASACAQQAATAAHTGQSQITSSSNSLRLIKHQQPLFNLVLSVLLQQVAHRAWYHAWQDC